jgi:hypothetical protein
MAQDIEVKIKVDASQAENSVNKFGDAIENTEKSITSLKGQLRQAQAEVAVLSDKFGATSKEAVNAAKKAAELTDRIGDAKALTDAFNPDAKFKALSGALSGVAGGFSAVTGVMGTLGGESKEVEQAILKVQSAMAISSGLQAVGESVDQFKILTTVIKNTSLAQQALTIYQTAYNYVNAATTTGLKLLRGALISTGIGALVVAVGMLIANFNTIKDTILRVIPALSKVGDGVMYVVHAITDFIGATSEAEREVDKLSAAAAKSLKNNEQYLKEHGSQLDEYTKQKIAAKNEYLKLVEEDGANQRAYALELNRKLKKIDDDRLASKKENKKEEVKTVKETNKEISEEEQKRLANEMQSATNAIAILDEIAKAKETPAQKELREYNEKKVVLEANNLDTSELTNAFLISQADAEYAIYEEKLASTKELTDRELAAEQAVKDAKRNALDTSLNILQQFAGKNKAVALGILAIQKGLAIADVVTGAAKAIGLAKASAAPTPINPPFLGPGVPNPSFLANAKIAGTSIVATKIGAATSIASILAAGIGSASSITAGGGGGATSSGGGGGSISTPATLAPNVNVVGASRTNAIAETIAQQGQQPIKAYVVANDVTTQQGLNRSIVTSASIG